MKKKIPVWVWIIFGIGLLIVCCGFAGGLYVISNKSIQKNLGLIKCSESFLVGLSDDSNNDYEYATDDKGDYSEMKAVFDDVTSSISYVPLDIEENLSIGDSSFLLYSYSTDKVYLNSEFFSNIKRVSVENVDEKEKIGTYKGYDLPHNYEYSEIFKFLLDTEILYSYEHIPAEICLYKVDDNRQEYVAYYVGEYYVCTNDCLNISYDFKMTLDKETGDIWVE
ncbi:hypothetical protein JW887_03700 [Candidatus Dojkabacteria bacterium]|nr:hypothetical protein [Candidatus Dojkabacteria bacterium]